MMNFYQQEINRITQRLEKAVSEKDYIVIELALDKIFSYQRKIKLLEGKTG